MSGNSECDWLSHSALHSSLSETRTRAEAAIGQFVHPSDEGGSAFEVREPSGDRLVSQQRPCVSTREYGGLECPGERGSTGDMAEMVMAKQRDSRALVKFATSLRWSCFYEAAFSSTYRASSSH